MKKILIAVVIAITGLTACIKETHPTTVRANVLAVNTWSMDNRAYRANKVDTSGGSFVAADTPAMGPLPVRLSFYFYNTLPVASGNYRVVLTPSAPDELSFVASNDSGSFASVDNPTVRASVTVSSSGKISLKLPPVNAASSAGSVKVVQANIVQH